VRPAGATDTLLVQDAGVRYNRPVSGSPSRIDRTAFRAVDWEEHIAEHDAQWLDYWLSQPVTTRIAGAMRCRWRVRGPLPRLDRSCFRVIDLADLTD
jgi:hypothetical protein